MKGKSVVIFLIIIFAIVAAYFISKQIRIISVNTEEKVIDVVLVRLLFSGEFNVTVPEIAKGIINKNINIAFEFSDLVYG